MKKLRTPILLLALLLFPMYSSFAYALINLNTRTDYDANVPLPKAQVEVETAEEAETEAADNQNIIINRASIEADTAGVAEIEPRDVVSNADLEAYAQSALGSDENIEEMRFSRGAVEVKYKETGRLLALLPITYTVTAITRADGTIEVRYPWFAAITVDNQEEIKTAMKIAVDNALKARMVGSVRAEGRVDNPSFTAAESAEVAAQMRAVLRGEFETE